jgi:hypothetical protein
MHMGKHCTFVETTARDAKECTRKQQRYYTEHVVIMWYNG